MQKVTKGVNEKVTYEVDFSRALETVWRPGYHVAVGDFIRPPNADGYVYECTAIDGTVGQTAHDEPNWPAEANAVVVDGSVTWTCRSFDYEGTDTIATRTVTADTGITVDGHSITQTVVLVTLSGGTQGESYDVQIKIVTVTGEEYTETLRIICVE